MISLIQQVSRKFIDPKTGEVLHEEIVHESLVRPDQVDDRGRLREDAFMLMYQKKLAGMAADRDFKGNDFRLFLILAARLNFGGWLEINQTALAEETGIPRPEISKSMRLLQNKQILIRSTKPHQGKKFQLNADYAFKGGKVAHDLTRNIQKGNMSLVTRNGERTEAASA